MLTHMALPSPYLAADSQRIPKGPLRIQKLLKQNSARNLKILCWTVYSWQWSLLIATVILTDQLEQENKNADFYLK